MTNEQWDNILEEEVDLSQKKMASYIGKFGPSTWPHLKEALTTMIKNMDEATEVYNMEKGE